MITLPHSQIIKLGELALNCTISPSTTTNHARLQILVTGLPDDRTQQQGHAILKAINTQLSIPYKSLALHSGTHIFGGGGNPARYSGSAFFTFETQSSNVDALVAALTDLETNHGSQTLEEFCPAYHQPENKVGERELGHRQQKETSAAK